jgi:hypothetical protein
MRYQWMLILTLFLLPDPRGASASSGDWERLSIGDVSFELPGHAVVQETTRATRWGPLHRTSYVVTLDDGLESWTVRVHRFPEAMRKGASDDVLFDATWRGGMGAAANAGDAKHESVRLTAADGRIFPGRRYKAVDLLVRGDAIFYLVESTLYELSAMRGRSATDAEFDRLAKGFRLEKVSASAQSTRHEAAPSPGRGSDPGGWGVRGTGTGGVGTLGGNSKGKR